MYPNLLVFKGCEQRIFDHRCHILAIVSLDCILKAFEEGECTRAVRREIGRSVACASPARWFNGDLIRIGKGEKLNYLVSRSVSTTP